MAKKLKVNKQEEVEIKKEEVNKKEQNILISVLELLAIIVAIIVIIAFFPNTPLWNIVVLLLILTVLIFVHEGGHFLLGKMCGVHIYEFALGMGPKVLGFKRKKDPTEYNLRAFPIGGYCAMAGEEGEDDTKLPKEKFMCNKPKIQRLLILCAGVFMNFVTAFIILFAIAMIWGSQDLKNTVDNVVKDSPAEKAGIVSGDQILKINGKKVRTWDDISLITILKNKKDYLEYEIKHKDGKIEKIKIVPDEYVQISSDKEVKIDSDNTVEKIKENYKLKKIEKRKVIGISQNNTIRHGFVNSIKYACTKFVSLSTMMIKVVFYLITGQLGLNSLSGPVGMYSVVGEAATYGLSNILFLAAYLSINLGVINILPFPAFDGGRVVFVIIEAITRKKVDPKVETIFHTIGFILLMLLMLIITVKDVANLF